MRKVAVWLPRDEAEEKMLSFLRGMYGYDVLSFKLTGKEVVEAMAMAYKSGKEDAAKENK
jgi:hypothetical protein